MEAQEGKTTRSRPLWGTLCAAGFGSAPVLTSSGTGTQMYSSLVVLFRASKPNSEFSTKSEGSFFFFFHFFFLKMTGNKLMAETIRGEQSSVDLFYMSDRRECTRGPLQRFTTSLWWVLFLFLRPLHLLIPKELEEIKWMLFHLQPVLWPEMTNDLSVLWFCKRLGGKKTTTHLLFLFNDLFSILCQGWSLN